MARDVFGIVGTTQAGQLHVEEVVAEGGFGVVYRAMHRGFRAPVALKCLKIPGTMTADDREGFLEKFREEGELLFRLSASIPEVVRPLHVDALTLPDGRFVPFIALEWLEGQALDQILERRRAAGKAPMGLQKVVKLMQPIAHALARAHRFPGPGGAVSITHRDLKPENIFVAELNGAPAIKILDFGIAKAKSAATQRAGRLTVEDGVSAFTPAYGAPEQWLPKRFGETGPWTDVWGLAITMVEALAGRPPIDGELAAMMGTAIDEKRRPTPRAEGVVIALEVEEVFVRALAVDPRARTPDVQTFWSELEVAMGLPPSLGAIDARREGVARLLSGAPGPVGVEERSRAGVEERSNEPTVPAPLFGPSSRATSLRPQQLDARAPLRSSEAPDLDMRGPLPSHPALPSFSPSAPRQSATAAPGVDSALASGLDSAPPPKPLSEPPFALVTMPPPARGSRLSSRQPASSDVMDLRELGVRLRRPMQLIAAAIGITIVDLLVTRLAGVSLLIGPLRPAWIAGPIALFGVGLALWRIFGERGDE